MNRSLASCIMSGIIFCAAAGGVAYAADETSLHKKPFGTSVSGQFHVGERVFFVPDGGSWILVAANEYRVSSTGSLQGPMMGQVLLLDVRDNKVIRGMLAKSTLEQSQLSDWLDEPCKREDTISKIDAKRSFTDQYCVVLNHRINVLRETSGWLRQAGLWILENRIEVPQTSIGVEMTRFVPQSFMTVAYLFNPEFDGFDPSSQPGWRDNDWHKDRISSDPAKVKYTGTLLNWAKEIMPIYEKSFEGKIPFGAKFPVVPDLAKVPVRAK